jgi:hypothetical protein
MPAVLETSGADRLNAAWHHTLNFNCSTPTIRISETTGSVIDDDVHTKDTRVT